MYGVMQTWSDWNGTSVSRPAGSRFLDTEILLTCRGTPAEIECSNWLSMFLVLQQAEQPPFSHWAAILEITWAEVCDSLDSLIRQGRPTNEPGWTNKCPHWLLSIVDAPGYRLCPDYTQTDTLRLSSKQHRDTTSWLYWVQIPRLKALAVQHTYQRITFGCIGSKYAFLLGKKRVSLFNFVAALNYINHCSVLVSIRLKMWLPIN